MNYPIDTPAQARAVLRALRQARGLSQVQAGQLLGVSQKRIARIEAAPDRTGLDQITKLITLLGGRVVVEDATPATAPKTKPAKAGW